MKDCSHERGQHPRLGTLGAAVYGVRVEGLGFRA